MIQTVFPQILLLLPLMYRHMSEQTDKHTDVQVGRKSEWSHGEQVRY